MAATTRRQLKLGAILAGAGTDFTQWRDPDLPGDASVDIGWYIENARLAEAAKFDLVFIVDSPFITPNTAPHFLNRLEPLTLLSALAVSTSRIGLVGTLTTTYWEPYNVARLFGSLDQISHGRAGWNVVTTGLEGAARNYNQQAHLDHAVRYRRAREFVDVVQGLWDSYEDDAFPRDKSTGVFLDKSKQHALNHRGEFFSVDGPLALARSPQGQPVIFQAGDSDAGRRLGAEIADATFAGVDDLESAQAYYRDLKSRAVALGRDPASITVMPGIAPILAETDEEALALGESRNEHQSIEKKLVELGRAFNYHDFSQYPLDGPFPDVSNLTLNSYKGRAERILRGVKAGGLSLREAAERYGASRFGFVGSPETVARQIENWFLNEAADGFNIRVTSPRDFHLFRTRVVPILQQRGLFRAEYETDTLRGHLGLPVPENRWTTQRKAPSSALDAA
ncbi:putative monooxygenase [Acetobacter nitrogenifigens DSM 23921 = NBRC 105050]|uniref:Monooxygenase n=1 Tax=Acetobacter nitrogenifigens DSM 23921 = NBRC 105050 TaxID=1120919 RepID=A0A511XC64_9PROT|nr:LLM class flavin-dependent oxidoreductase [Acetobacter nitrogenifigens]GBQ88716.1 putative monooxygenase [Acetobacter nitrogenifigens DSM 23921 = NBRC 105050]GEN60475.1 monooxygenase [Acetobacter nitrogenifigens DSM 23921 = NBRC 105050]